MSSWLLRRGNFLKYISNRRLSSVLLLLGGFLLGCIVIRTLNTGVYVFSLSRLWKSRKHSFSSLSAPRYIGTEGFRGAELADWLFQIASLHGIGSRYGRKPIFERQLKQSKAWAEVSESFPEVQNFVEFDQFRPKSDITNINYGHGCCQYFQDGILEHIQTKTVLFLRQQLQSYKFFEPVKQQVEFMMTFHPSLEAKIQTLAKHLYSDDVSHKACVHIVYNPAAPQDTDTALTFLTASLRFVLETLSTNLTASAPTGSPPPTFSLVVFGMDPADTGLIIADSMAYYRVYRPMPELTDAENLYLASQYCDSMLITATTDKLAWWMGYLQRTHVPVFYNAQAGGMVDEIDLADSDYFPVRWTSLTMEGDTVVVNKRFHLSRWQHKIFSKRRKHGQAKEKA